MSDNRSTENDFIAELREFADDYVDGGPIHRMCYRAAAEIERLRAQCASLKAGYDSMFDKAAELERRLAHG